MVIISIILGSGVLLNMVILLLLVLVVLDISSFLMMSSSVISKVIDINVMVVSVDVMSIIDMFDMSSFDSMLVISIMMGNDIIEMVDMVVEFGIVGMVVWIIDDVGVLMFSGGSFVDLIGKCLFWYDYVLLIMNIKIMDEIMVIMVLNYGYLFVSFVNVVIVIGLNKFLMSGVISI